MENRTVLFIYTRWRQAHKWIVGEDGLVDYGGERIPPSEVPARFDTDYPMFDVLRAEVCERIEGDGMYPYSWVDIERYV